jgi:hypothetical protein
MLVKIIKKNKVYKLILIESIPNYIYDPNSPIELMTIDKFDFEHKYRILDYRHTDEFIDPTPYLMDTPEVYRANEDDFNILLNNKPVDFFIKVLKNKKGVNIVRWNDFNGVVFEDGDIAFDGEDRLKESYVWSFKEAMNKLEEAKIFWTAYHETNLDKSKIQKKHRPYL